MASEDVKPDVKPDAFSLKLKDVHGAETIFKLKRSTKFEKILGAYANRAGIDAKSIKLVFEGRVLQDHQTPDSEGIEEGDVVEVVMQQTGGASE